MEGNLAPESRMADRQVLSGWRIGSGDYQHFTITWFCSVIRYEHHPDVPLGVKAVVVAVYEPPQESSRDSLRILPDSNDEVLDEVCENLGLRRLGWIFTDLVTTGILVNSVL